ncbi:MAG: hypothetical protein ACR2PJ_01475 [Pseudomonadales bacterium]
MAEVNDKEKRLLFGAVDAEVALTEKEDSDVSQDIKDAREVLVEGINKIARDGSIEDIVGLERKIITTELERPANTPEKKSSLLAAVDHLDNAMEMLDKLRNRPDAYLETDRDHSMPSARRYGLPYEKGAKFFASHLSRLRNMAKSRLSESDNNLIMARINAISAAQKMYMALQRKVLGV